MQLAILKKIYRIIHNTHPLHRRITRSTIPLSPPPPPLPSKLSSLGGLISDPLAASLAKAHGLSYLRTLLAIRDLMVRLWDASALCWRSECVDLVGVADGGCGAHLWGFRIGSRGVGGVGNGCSGLEVYCGVGFFFRWRDRLVSLRGDIDLGVWMRDR